VILLLNGAFGSGKTTVARLIVRRLRRAALYDPELIGVALQRSARLFAWHVGDFQDLRIWRRLTIGALRVMHLFWPNVIVPMAFSNAAYLEEIRDGIGGFEPRVFHFCLIAPLDVIHDRLQRRNVNPTDADWQLRRAAECCEVHQQQEFATQVLTTDRDAIDIANEIVDAMTEGNAS
jgi:hypothetical protein